MSEKTEVCNCFSENLERVKEHLISSGQIPKGAKDIKFEWEGRFLNLSGKDCSPVSPKIKFEYRPEKKGGGHAATLKRNNVGMSARHCCFCGRKYNS